MTSDFTVSDKRKLVDLARAVAERAQLAGPPTETQVSAGEIPGLAALAIQNDAASQAVAEIAQNCRQQVDAVNRHVAKQLDAILLILERFEVELTALQGEVDGLRAEQRIFMQRVAQAEETVRGGAEELAAQLSRRFLSHLDGVDRAATELIEGRKQFAEATAALLDRLQN